MLYCTHCGHEISGEQDICLHCGCYVKPVAQPKKEQKDKNDTYALIGFIFAFLAVHPAITVLPFAFSIRGLKSTIEERRKLAIAGIVIAAITSLMYLILFLSVIYSFSS